MNDERGGADSLRDGADGLATRLTGLAEPPSAGHAVRILRAVGIPARHYDAYVRADGPVGPLYVSCDEHRAITGSALPAAVGGPESFEAAYHARVGRPVFPVSASPPGLSSALRTGRTGKLPFALAGLTDAEQALLGAVRSIPPGQLRPASWVSARAGVSAAEETVVALLARNPAPVLVPCHRVEVRRGAPGGAPGPYPPEVGLALRVAEGVDVEWVSRFAERQVRYLGSDTTRIYCHPTCAHARRITPVHQVPFRSAGEAVASGYRGCKSCLPEAA
ncbi:MGMT family protein [Streptomyces sp. NPDC001700]